MANQVLSIYMAQNGYLKDIATSDVRKAEDYMHKFFERKYATLVEDIESKGIIEDPQALKNAMDDCFENYKGE